MSLSLPSSIAIMDWNMADICKCGHQYSIAIIFCWRELGKQFRVIYSIITGVWERAPTLHIYRDIARSKRRTSHIRTGSSPSIQGSSAEELPNGVSRHNYCMITLSFSVYNIDITHYVQPIYRSKPSSRRSRDQR